MGPKRVAGPAPEGRAPKLPRYEVNVPVLRRTDAAAWRRFEREHETYRGHLIAQGAADTVVPVYQCVEPRLEAGILAMYLALQMGQETVYSEGVYTATRAHRMQRGGEAALATLQAVTMSGTGVDAMSHYVARFEEVRKTLALRPAADDPDPEGDAPTDGAVVKIFVANLSGSLRERVKRRNPKTLQEALRVAFAIADQLEKAEELLGRGGSSGTHSSARPPVKAQVPNNKGGASEGVICHECGKPGHIRPDCPRRAAKAGVGSTTGPGPKPPRSLTTGASLTNTAGARPSSSPADAARVAGERACFVCGDKTHLAPACPQRKQSGQKPSGAPGPSPKQY